MPKVPKHNTDCIYLGIDPGKSGAIVTLDSMGRVTRCFKMPDTEKDIFNALLAIADGGAVRCVLEQVQGYIGEGGEHRGSAMFTFGWNYGNVRMALLAAGISFETIVPHLWQKGLGIPPRKKQGRKTVESKQQFKNRLKAKAQQLFPRINVTLAVADALLIATYCKRLHEGSLR